MKTITFVLNFFSFIFNPSFNRIEEKTHIKILNTFVFIIFNFIFLVLFGILQKYLPISKFIDIRWFSFPIGSVQTFLLVGLILPIIEEIIFRLPLQYSNTNIIVSLSFIISWIFSGIYKLQFLKPYTIIQTVAFALLFISILCFVFKRHSSIPTVIQSLYNKWNISIFYAFVFSFALLHLITYKNLTIALIPIVVLAISHKLIIGFSLSYLRIKYGILYSIVLHCLINSVLITVMSKSIF